MGRSAPSSESSFVVGPFRPLNAPLEAFFACDSRDQGPEATWKPLQPPRVEKLLESLVRL